MPGQYTIQSGDTLGGIAARHGLRYQDLASWNNIADPNRIYAGKTLNLGAPQAAAPQPATASGIPVPEARKAFSEVMPWEKVFNQNLIQGLAESQIMPEIQRQQSSATEDLNRGLASSGGYRLGSAGVQREGLNDAFSRQAKEQTGQFGSSMKDYLTDWYNRQSESYYKNPSAFVMPTLPSYDQFVQDNPSLASAYNNATNIQTQFKDYFK